MSDARRRRTPRITSASRMRSRPARGVIASLAIVGSVLGGSSAATSATASHPSPCSRATVATYSHVVWIVLENVGYSVVGSPQAPYLNALTATCGLATNDVAVAHPSLPNYIALTSGSTQGIVDDNEPSAHRLHVANIFSQLRGNWRALAESMPSPCDRVTSGQYAARHNPAVYYTNLPDCARHDLSLTTPLNLAAAFTMITPNVCDDMHSCPVSTGDAWLRRYVALIIASPQYRARSLALFITFDENNQAPSNQVPTIVVAPTVPAGLRVARRFTHYSLLRTTEALLHLGFLGGARTAASLVAPFHL